MRRETPLTVNLENPVPVYLVYFTAWTEDDATVAFRPDVYGHDAPLRQALAEASSEASNAQTNNPACETLRRLIRSLRQASR